MIENQYPHLVHPGAFAGRSLGIFPAGAQVAAGPQSRLDGERALKMARGSYFSSPLLLGFEEIERVLDRVNKTAHDGYPPYNIEQIGADRIRITLAVAGFDRELLS